MMSKVLWIGFISNFIFTLSATGQLSLQLPLTASKALDQKFPAWKLIDYSTTLYGDKVKDIYYWGKPYFKCNLNRDTITDYALGISVDEDSALKVHFIAIVSLRDSFSLFVLGTYSNPKPLSVYLYLYQKGEEIANFGFDDTNVPENLLRSWNKKEMFSTFHTDCISLHRTDKNVCSAFVFEGVKFWSFEACD